MFAKLIKNIAYITLSILLSSCYIGNILYYTNTNIVNNTSYELDVISIHKYASGKLYIHYRSLPKNSELSIDTLKDNAEYIFTHKNQCAEFLGRSNDIHISSEDIQILKSNCKKITSYTTEKFIKQINRAIPKPKSAICIFIDNSGEITVMSEEDTPWADIHMPSYCKHPSAPYARAILSKEIKD